MTAADKAAFLRNGGETGALIQGFNWSETSLGPIHQWPSSLTTALQILASSRFPMQILWGSDYIQFYNDAYIPIAGNKHPQGIGQPAAECWAEVWDFSKPLLDRVMATGEATWSEDQLLVLDRNGAPAEGYFTFSYAPIWLDPNQVGGIFIAVNETTAQVLGKRREQALRAKAQAIAENLENVLTSISDEFFMLDASWQFTYINDLGVEALGKQRQDLLGHCIWDVFPDLVATPLYTRLYEAVASQEATSFELFCQVSQRWLEHRVYPFGKGVSLLRVDISDRKYLEQALDDSQDQLNSLVNTAAASIARGRFFANRTYVIDYRSVGCEVITGYALAEITPELWAERTFQEDWQANSGAIFDAVFAQQPVTVEYRFRHKDGTIRWIADSLTSRYDQGQNCWMVTLVGIDITARKAAEAALQHSGTHLAMAQRVAQFGSWELFPHDQHIVWSGNMFEQFGFAPAETAPLYGAIMERIHPDDRSLLEQHIALAIAERQAYAIDLRVQLPNGNIKYLHSRCEPVLNTQNQVSKLIGTCLDITDRKQIELALRESEERYRVLAESMPQMAWMGDHTGVKYWNQKWYTYTGLSELESLGIEGVQAVHPDDQPHILTLWEEGLTHGSAFEVEHRIRRHDGLYRWFINRGLPVQDNTGHITRWVGTITDIDDKKQLEDQRARLLEQERVAREAAESANRIKDEFLAVLSHELRSPLNPILGWARLLRTGKLDAAKTAAALETIERNANLQAQLIDDLLDVSRILRGKLVLNGLPIALPTVIHNALETVHTASEAKAIAIQTHLDPAPLKVKADANRLQQVIWNLLSNAVKFTPTGGQITLSLRYEAAWAILQVTDTGKGIEADFLPHVFDRFRQADSTTTRVFGGLGLGLAIAHQIVEMHGGTIEVASSGKDQGTTFTVRLPLLTPTPESPPPPIPVDLAPDLSHVHILVVEDNPDSRQLITLTLEQLGTKVIAVASAAEAIATLARLTPDMLISDIGMPETDGYSLIQQLRQMAQTRDLPAIALTSYTSPSDQQAILAAGFQKHLPKPMNTIHLIQAILDLLPQSAGSK
jgi:PAS domain S-box-containing protein